MRWTPGGPSEDIEDRRDEGGGGIRGPHIGIGGAIILLVLSLIFRKNFFAMLSPGSSTGPRPAVTEQQHTPEEEKRVAFVSFVLDDVQKTWEKTLPHYSHAKLVLFRDAARSGCGFAEAATGPFYCPSDRKVYLDLDFFDELRSRFGAPGEFAEAYVVAHELGHHVQNLLGIEPKVRHAMESNPRQQNELSVRLELQADCYAGVWAHSTQERQLLEKGDVESALGAAAAVGDDRLQKMSTGRVQPESFTHGSSRQRTEWFGRGFESGSLNACDTFGAR